MNKLAVLVAEDNPDTRALVHWMVETEGFNVQTAEDGARALDLLNQYHPHIIVTDLMMPQIDGLELIRRVRAMEEFSNIPIIAMSAYGDGYLSEAIRAGATTALRKPEDLSAIVETINRVISESRTPLVQT